MHYGDGPVDHPFPHSALSNRADPSAAIAWERFELADMLIPLAGR